MPCDLVTGDERVLAGADGEPAAHVSCTVEMARTNVEYDVAVIDEIQMVRDAQRGWAWTRALLGRNVCVDHEMIAGVCAREVHVCGEAAAVNLVRQLVAQCDGDEFQLRTYERMTPLRVADRALGALENVQDGDAIVCFNKASIYDISTKVRVLAHLHSSICSWSRSAARWR